MALATFLLVALISFSFWFQSQLTSVSQFIQGDKFTYLNQQHTNACTGPGFINSKTDTDRLQGSCCSAMNLHRYTEQVQNLKQYAAIAQIPPDPYDIPVTLAKKLLGYQQDISLTTQEQQIYNQAMKLSHEGGPCCCRCWRWDAFEGLAKYLITRHQFTAQQIAHVWDLEDGCGGSGHVDHDTS